MAVAPPRLLTPRMAPCCRSIMRLSHSGATETNYQIMPGDRIFIAGDRVTALNNNLGKATAPVERVMGLISLGAATIESVERLLFKQENNKQE